jgi:hypothetical protein
MALSMSRPTKHHEKGIYWVRRRVPADLVEKLGRKEITKSLGARHPTRRKHSEMLLELVGLSTTGGLAATPSGVTIKLSKPARLRSKGLGDEEAIALLRAANALFKARRRSRPSRRSGGCLGYARSPERGSANWRSCASKTSSSFHGGCGLR